MFSLLCCSSRHTLGFECLCIFSWLFLYLSVNILTYPISPSSFPSLHYFPCRKTFFFPQTVTASFFFHDKTKLISEVPAEPPHTLPVAKGFFGEFSQTVVIAPCHTINPHPIWCFLCNLYLIFLPLEKLKSFLILTNKLEGMCIVYGSLLDLQPSA